MRTQANWLRKLCNYYTISLAARVTKPEMRLQTPAWENNLKYEEANFCCNGLLLYGSLINPYVKLETSFLKCFFFRRQHSCYTIIFQSIKKAITFLSKYLDTPAVACEHYQHMLSDRLVNTVFSCLFDSRKRHWNDS